MPKTISQHVVGVITDFERIRTLTPEEKARYSAELNRLFDAKQRGCVIIAPVNPGSAKEDLLVDAYLRDLKPSDVLPDPPWRFHSRIVE